MVRGFRVWNLRSIKDTGPISIKKINIIVGKNSSGKSTILRFLPLLRQSVEQKTRGTMLWYGRLVDFGSFQNAARHHDVRRGVKFEFEMTLSRRRANVFRRQFKYGLKPDARFQEIKLSASISFGANDEGVGVIREIVLTLGDDVVRIRLDASGEVECLEVMDELVTLDSDEEWAVSLGQIMPTIILVRHFYESDDDGNGMSYAEPVDTPFRDRVAKDLRTIVHGRTRDERLLAMSGRLFYGSAESVKNQLMNLPGATQAMKERFSRLPSESSAIKSLRRNLLLTRLDNLMMTVDEELREFSGSVQYIEPLRAIAERYYRHQDLAVDEIDSRGANTAMFLSSLRPPEMARLQNWMYQNMGFSVSVDRGPGHIQVMVRDGIHEPRNVADLGFGYSQLLPIVLQLWKACDGADFPLDEQVLIAMEQPELHLHPHYQARLADALSAVASIRYDAPRIFVETHSDHLINRLGALVADQKLNREDVQILVVNDDGVDGDSSVVPVDFDADGMLGSNWPLGFFSPGWQ